MTRVSILAKAVSAKAVRSRISVFTPKSRSRCDRHRRGRSSLLYCFLRSLQRGLRQSEPLAIDLAACLPGIAFILAILLQWADALLPATAPESREGVEVQRARGEFGTTRASQQVGFCAAVEGIAAIHLGPPRLNFALVSRAWSRIEAKLVAMHIMRSSDQPSV
jgi:hypothetical protein